MEIDEHFEKLYRMIDNLDGKVSAIDTSITGDERRGTVGMKQKIETLTEDFEAHTQQDLLQFSEIQKAKWWIGGAVSGVGIVITLMAYVINLFAKQ